MAAGAAAGVTAVKAAEAKPKTAVATAPLATKPIAYEEPVGNTLITTVAAGACCVVTWGTAAALAYFCFSS